MSIENHPNINAAGFTADIIEAYLKRVRGNADKYPKLALPVLNKRLVEFVSNLSRDLDKLLGG